MFELKKTDLNKIIWQDIGFIPIKEGISG